MRFHIMLLVAVVMSIGLSVSGGGGPAIFYMAPGVFDLPPEIKVEEGFLAFGGYGYGLSKIGLVGGLGAGGEFEKGTYSYSYSMGGFWWAYPYNLDPFSVYVGAVIGGSSVSVGRTVEGENGMIDFQNGTCPGILSISRDGWLFMPSVMVSVRVFKWLEFMVGISGMLNYFPKGWIFEDGTPVEGYEPKQFELGYSIVLGVTWGS